MGIEIVILSLSAYALAHLLVNEEGPYEILTKFRRFVGITQEIEDELSEGKYESAEQLGVFGKMFLCDICASTAIGSSFGSIYLLNTDFHYLCIPLAVVGLIFAIKRV